jgi:hypothetical protein
LTIGAFIIESKSILNRYTNYSFKINIIIVVIRITSIRRSKKYKKFGYFLAALKTIGFISYLNSPLIFIQIDGVRNNTKICSIECRTKIDEKKRTLT